MGLYGKKMQKELSKVRIELKWPVIFARKVLVVMCSKRAPLECLI